MRSKLVRAGLLGFITGLLLLPLAVPGASAGEMQFQVHLVWATDDPKPPAGKDYQPLEPEIRKQIKALKWKNYFEVRHIDFSLSPAGGKKVAISDKCSIEIKDLGNSNVEVILIGKGKEVARVKQVLRKGEILVPAGDAPNETAWLAILKRVQ
jgi:acylphosphatase